MRSDEPTCRLFRRARNALPLLLAGGLLAAGCRNRGQAGPPPGPPQVGFVTVEPQRLVLTRELPGRTSAYLVAEIRPQASGILRERLFTEGADVKAGDVLYEIEAGPYEAAYANAEAAVAAAKANHSTALAALSLARANQAKAEAGVAAARAGHASALAAREAARAALVAARAAVARAEANAAPIRLRVERFRELVASKAVSQQDFDDVSAALTQAEAGIQSAQAGLQAAEADIGRAEAAVQVAEAEKQNADAGLQAAQAQIQTAEAGVEAAQAAVKSAQAGLETARINLAYTRIKAPISGRIGRSAVTAGALVAAHQPLALASIQQLDPIYVDVPQATAERLRLQRRAGEGRAGQDESARSVKLILEDNTPYPLEGTLQFRDVSVDPSTGSSIVRMVFPNPDGMLLPGMFVRAVLEEGVVPDAILVPQEAVTRDPAGNPLVMVVGAEGKAEPRPLVLDRAIGNRWLVTSGLKAGDRVIVEGLQRARPGTVVNAVPAGSPGPGAPGGPGGRPAPQAGPKAN